MSCICATNKSHQNLGEVSGLKAMNSGFDRLFEVLGHSLNEELADVNGSPQKLEVPLLEENLVAVSRGFVSDLRTRFLKDGLVTLLDHDTGGPALVVEEDVLRKLENELVERQVDLRLNFVIKVAGLELMQRALGCVIVQIKGVKDISGNYEGKRKK